MEEQFLAIGLEEKTVKNIVKNAKLSQILSQLLNDISVKTADKKIGKMNDLGNFLYDICSKTPEALEKFRITLGQYVRDLKIDSKEKLEQALTYLKNNAGDSLDIPAFEKFAGVGVVTTTEAVEEAMREFLDGRKESLLQERYNINLSTFLYVAEYLATFKKNYPFFPGGAIKDVLNQQIEQILGPKNEQDQIKKVQPKELKPVVKKEEVDENQGPNMQEFVKDLSNFEGRHLESSVNSQALLKKHRETTKGAIITRFPPEPNGYLHIGHAKAMRFSFTVANAHKGYTNLRFDDTNPEKENIEYIENIKENVNWLGYKPKQITYSSDNFQFIYDCALTLIKKGKAYVCAQTKQEISESRSNKTPSQYRNRSIEENLRLFEEMRLGLHEEGSLSLRLKIDYAHDNPTLRDPHVYRIRYTGHPHCGSKWCIYPLYDFTHCTQQYLGICDSYENITHSFCSLEFEIRRELYYWILKELDLFRPMVWEYSRLNIRQFLNKSNTVLSKRKLHKLIFENIVNGWDDPRIFTLNGLRRRGYPAEVINEFCDQIGVSRRGNENIIPLHFLESILRKHLDIVCARRLCVIDPVKLTLSNLKENQVVQAFHYPKNPEKGSYDLTVSKQLWVERSDCQLLDSKDHFGFAPGKVVGLKYFGIVKTLQFFKFREVKSENGKITEVVCEHLENTQEKPKSYLHWISLADSNDCQVNVYDVLFTDYNPNELEDYIQAINKDSLIVKTGAKMHKNLLNAKQNERFQFERLGFYIQDKESTSKNVIWNQIVSLQDREKAKANKKNQN